MIKLLIMNTFNLLNPPSWRLPCYQPQAPFDLQLTKHRRDRPLPGRLIAEESSLGRDEALLPAFAHITHHLLPFPHLVLSLELNVAF